MPPRMDSTALARASEPYEPRLVVRFLVRAMFRTHELVLPGKEVGKVRSLVRNHGFHCKRWYEVLQYQGLLSRYGSRDHGH